MWTHALFAVRAPSSRQQLRSAAHTQTSSTREVSSDANFHQLKIKTNTWCDHSMEDGRDGNLQRCETHTMTNQLLEIINSINKWFNLFVYDIRLIRRPCRCTHVRAFQLTTVSMDQWINDIIMIGLWRQSEADVFAQTHWHRRTMNTVNWQLCVMEIQTKINYAPL